VNIFFIKIIWIRLSKNTHVSKHTWQKSLPGKKHTGQKSLHGKKHTGQKSLPVQNQNKNLNFFS
jgi:hypothetical protein